MVQQLGSFEKVLRVGEGRRLKRLAQQAAFIGTLEPEFEALSDEQLAAKTVEFKERVENGEPLDEILFEAFAAMREAFKRTMDVRLFDVQLMGGIVLHEGDIAEMKTGEGKTFVATQALYLNALDGQGHAPRHGQRLPRPARREWTRPVFETLGMRTAFIENMMPFDSRGATPTQATSPTGRTRSSASTTSATTWPSRSTGSSSAAIPTRSWTRSTRSSSTRRARR